MEDLEDSEIQFSEWTESGDLEPMDTDDGELELQQRQGGFSTEIADKQDDRIEDSPRNLTPAVSCFPVECDGKMFLMKEEREHATLNGYLAPGVMERLLHPEEVAVKTFKEPVIKLFGSKFAVCSALVCQTDSLFYLLRQQIFKLENMQTEEGILPLSHDANQKCIDVRKECAHFMAYLHFFINNCLLTSRTTLHLPDNQLIERLLHMSTMIRKQLEALVQFLGRLTELPIASLIRADTPGVFSSSRPSAVSHLFHLYLDLVWNTLQGLWEILLKQGKENRSHSEVYDIVTAIKSVLMPLLWDLTALAAVSYNKVNRADSLKTSPYPCSCVSEIWVLLIQTMDHLSAEFDIEPFWSSFSGILNEVTCPEDTTNSLQNENQDSLSSYAPSNFNCKDPVGFSWWLVSQVAPLYWFNEKGAFTVKKKSSAPGNWVFVFDLLKSSLNALKDGHDEAQRRFYLKCCISVSIHWSANTTLVLWLWDYFHKRMNDLFVIPSNSLHGMTTVSLTSSQWMDQCFDRCRGVQTSIEQDNSFMLLLRLIAIHLNKLLSTGSLQGWKQMKGRFYSKFHKRRMEELNETGLKHFLSLFLTLSCAADLEDVANKMCSFLDLLDFNSEHPGKKVVILKGLFSLMLIYKERKVDFGYLACKLADTFATVAKEYTEICNTNRDKAHQRHLWDLVALYLDGTQEIFEHKNKQDLSETKLLESEGFQWLFSICRENELRYLLTFVISVLDTTRPQGTEGLGSQENRPDISGSLWTHIFPPLQKLTRDRGVVTSLPINLADTMAGFALRSLSRHPVQVPGTPGVSFLGLLREYGTEDDMPASFSCQFLCHVVATPGVVDILEAESLQTHVIHTWFRCLLQLAPSHENCAVLTRSVAKLPEMEWLTKDQAGLVSSSNSENTLKLFIMSVGTYNSTLTKFDEVIQFRERSQIYFGDVAKYIDSFVSTGGPQDSLRHAFSVSGLLFKHCYKIIYSKTQPHCLLPRLLDQLIVPLHSNKKTMLPAVLQCVKAYLHWFLQGLSYLDFRRDDFIKRKIRQMFGKYFHPLCQKSQAAASQPGSVAVKNPFLVALKGSLMAEPTQDASDFRQFAVEIIADSFLQLPQPPQNLTSTLYFLVQLFKRTQSSKEIARNTPCLLAPVLGCLLACNARSPAHEPPNIRRQATDLLALMMESCNDPLDSSYRDSLLPNMRNFVFNNLQQFQGLVFRTFEPLTVLDADLIAFLIPAFKQSITQSEQTRGVGSDSQLRTALRNLLQRIGRADEIELH